MRVVLDRVRAVDVDRNGLWAVVWVSKDILGQ